MSKTDILAGYSPSNGIVAYRRMIGFKVGCANALSTLVVVAEQVVKKGEGVIVHGPFWFRIEPFISLFGGL